MSRKTYRKKKQPRRRRSSWLWLAVGALLLVIGGGLMTWFTSGTGPAEAPEVIGAPRLAVEQTVIDEGYVKLDTRVRTTFHLKNVGDQPLRILGQPRVELVEGC